MAERQALFDRDAEIGSSREANTIGQRVHRMIHVEEDLGDRADVNDSLKKTEGRREQAAALDDGDGADGVQRDVRYSRQNDGQKVTRTVVLMGETVEPRTVGL